MQKTIPILHSDIIRQDGSGRLFRYLLRAVSFVGSVLFAAIATVTVSAGNLDSSYDINVLVIKYFHINQNTCYPVDPTTGQAVFTPSNCLADQKAATTYDDGTALYQGAGPGYYWNFSNLTRAVQDQVDAAKTAIEKGSTYLGTRTTADTAPRDPALRYQLIYPRTDVESIGPLPFLQPDPIKYPNYWYVDYNAILDDYNICNYVDNKGVREVWILVGHYKDGYNGFNTSESRMGVSMNEDFGEVANGGGPVALRRCGHTYRVYTHTYDRSDLFMEVWGHQIERELEHVSGNKDVSGNKVGPELFSRFNVSCADNSVAPCYPMDPTRLVEATGGFGGQYYYLTPNDNGTPDLTDDFYDLGSPMMLSGSPVTSNTPNILFPSALTNWTTADGGPVGVGSGNSVAGVCNDPGQCRDYRFGAAWSGLVIPPATDDYIFKTITDDGVRLTIQDINGTNKRILIDKWRGFAGTQESNPIRLNVGQWYLVQMDYNETGGGAIAQLRWKSTSSLPTIPKIARCGTMHTAPNATNEYDRKNSDPNTAGSDCNTNWQPEGLGELDYNISCSTWGCGLPEPKPFDPNNYNYGPFIHNNAVLNYSSWHWVYMPGRNNNKMNNGQQLRNWWDVHGDFDGVKTCNTTLLDSSACVADLAILYFFGTPNPVNVGVAFYYYLSVSNNGPGTVPDGRVKVTLPSGSTFVPGGSSPECDASGLTVTCYLGKLIQGGNRTFYLSVIPPPANSTIMATATTVLPGTFQDTVTANNSVTATNTVVMADLISAVLTVTASGTNLSINDRVTNQGTGSAPAAFDIGYYLSTDTTYQPGTDTFLCKRSIASWLAAGASNPASATTLTTCPIPSTPAGSYNVIAVVDSSNAVIESNEANNNRAASVSISGVDLLPTTMSAARVNNSATKVNVTDTVKNQGNANAGAFTIKYYLSTNTTYEAGTDIALWNVSSGTGACNRTLNSLSAGAIHSKTLTCYKPSSAVTGVDYYVLVVDDSQGQVVEYNEGNNVKATAGTIRW